MPGDTLTISNLPKYPRTPYWPGSPSDPHPHLTINVPELLTKKPIVITEKIDGSNTLLHRGQVYSRSTTAQGPAPWQGLVKKHHAWKLSDSPWLIYGENIQAVHSIEYDPISEELTFMAFAIASANGIFIPFTKMQQVCQELSIPTVPLLYEGAFDSIDDLDQWVQKGHQQPSRLGGLMEGLVIRTSAGFHRSHLHRHSCKSVRANHVQTDLHWSHGWKHCRLASRTYAPNTP